MIVWLLIAADALACATCQDPDPRRSAIYLDMTVFMSLTPLIAFAGGGLWIWQRTRAIR
ncbi:MAG: hypothetical protein H6738_20520 [Alphaproteobacteria bacterium]|nr:hypothetical protein [Alphaproteobacteria bacterium]MCB9699176.1 hypothetical protein [Alphaproteobacteria bacterium]